MEEEFDLRAAIEEYERLSERATETPWFHNQYAKDEYDCGYMEVGPYELEGRYETPSNAYYESCVATFYGDNHDCDANAKLAVLSVNMVPALIARVRELEAKTATGLSEDVINAIDALNKWRNRV